MRKRAMIMVGLFAAFAVFMLIGLLLMNNPSLSTIGYVFLGLSGLMILAVIVYSVMGFLKPSWIKRVAEHGIQSPATVIENKAMSGIGGYQGEDVWLDLPVRVQPQGEPPFEANMKCRLSQTLLLKAGSQVQVHYDPADKSKVVLTSDPMKDLIAQRRNQ
jgi:hypothetical protein